MKIFKYVLGAILVSILYAFIVKLNFVSVFEDTSIFDFLEDHNYRKLFTLLLLVGIVYLCMNIVHKLKNKKLSIHYTTSWRCLFGLHCSITALCVNQFTDYHIISTLDSTCFLLVFFFLIIFTGWVTGNKIKLWWKKRERSWKDTLITFDVISSVVLLIFLFILPSTREYGRYILYAIIGITLTTYVVHQTLYSILKKDNTNYRYQLILMICISTFLIINQFTNLHILPTLDSHYFWLIFTPLALSIICSTGNKIKLWWKERERSWKDTLITMDVISSVVLLILLFILPSTREYSKYILYAIIGIALLTCAAHFLNPGNIIKWCRKKREKVIIRWREKHYKGEDTIDSFILPDDPITNPNEDVLGFSNLICEITNQVTLLDNNHSYRLAITAPWGSGKSSFNNLLKNELNEKGHITMTFNPRHSKSVTTIQSDFFQFLCNKLKAYNNDFSSTIRAYMRAMLISYNRNFTDIFDCLQRSNKTNEKELLDNAFKELPGKVIVMIEDLDRLTGEEILEVFKLMEGNASFNNIIFVVGFDKEYVSQVLSYKLTGHNKNEEEHNINSYCDKYFNWVFELPDISKETLRVTLIAKLANNCKEKVSQKSKETSQLLIGNPQIFSNINSLRDVTRISNLFFTKYYQISEKANFNDCLFITLLLYYDRKTYEDFKNELLEEYYNGKEIISKEMIYKRYKEQKERLKLSEFISKYIYMLDDKNSSSIFYLKNIPIYLFLSEYRHPINYIKEAYNNRLLFNIPDTCKLNQATQVNIKYLYLQTDVYTYCLNNLNIECQQLDDQAKILNYISHLFHFTIVLDKRMKPNLYEINFQMAKVSSLLKKSTYNKIKTYFKEEEYKNLITSYLKGDYSNNELFKNDKYYNQGDSTADFLNLLFTNKMLFPSKLIQHISLAYCKRANTEDSILTKKELIEIAIHNFNLLHEKYINNTNWANNGYIIYFEALYACIVEFNEKREINNCILDTGACKKALDLIKKHPQIYLDEYRNICSSNLTEDKNNYWEFIFGGAVEFESFLKSNKNVMDILALWENHKNHDFKY